MLQPLQYHKGFMCKPAGEMAQEWYHKSCMCKPAGEQVWYGPLLHHKVFMFKSSGEQIWYSLFCTTKAYVQTRWWAGESPVVCPLPLCLTWEYCFGLAVVVQQEQINNWIEFTSSSLGWSLKFWDNFILSWSGFCPQFIGCEIDVRSQP